MINILTFHFVHFINVMLEMSILGIFFCSPAANLNKPVCVRNTPSELQPDPEL